MRLADAVCPSVPSADDDDVLACSADLGVCAGFRRRAGRRRPQLAGQPSRALVEIVHREVDAAQLAAGHRQVTRHAGSRCDDHGVEARPQLRDVEVDSDVDAVAELDALCHELLEPPLDEPLLDLEIGNAETHEPAARLVALEHGDRVAGPVELLGAREPRRPGADHRHGAPRTGDGRLRHDPPLVPSAVDDRDLDLLDRDCIAFPDLEHARRLAGSRAKPAGELREVVRPVELDDRLVPAVAVHEVVPVGNQVSQRAPVMAERDARPVDRMPGAQHLTRRRVDQAGHDVEQGGLAAP